jgi:ABC-type iron transport system FetAB permease component
MPPWRQVRGSADVSNVCRPVFKRVLYTAMTPTINMLSVAGLISIPGMMTGQILAGSDAVVAAKYQVCSFFFLHSHKDARKSCITKKSESSVCAREK